MEAIVPQPHDEGDAQLIAALPPHVVAALDHLTSTERAGVRSALEGFTRHDHQGEAIPGPDSLFVLWAAPAVRVIIRRQNPEGPIQVEDIVRPATLQKFAQAQRA